jgi:hypothetical protein
MTVTRKAACCCGECSIEVEGEPILNGICHCDNCRRRTGSAFGWSAYFPDERIVAREGEPSVYVLDLADPGRAQRYFCPRCGTTLYWKSGASPDNTGVAAGCLTGEPLVEPGLSVTDDKRLAWVAIPEGWARMP